MQIKSFVIKPTHRNGFFACDLMVLPATGMDFEFAGIKARNLGSIAIFRLSVCFRLVGAEARAAE